MITTLETTKKNIVLVDLDQIQKDNAADTYRKIKQVRELLEQMEERIFKIVEEDPKNTPGIGMKYGAFRRSITDTKKAYQAVSEVISSKDFTSCCTVKIGELEKKYKDAMELPEAHAKVQLEGLLEKAGCLETKQGSPSLVLFKEEK